MKIPPKFRPQPIELLVLALVVAELVMIIVGFPIVAWRIVAGLIAIIGIVAAFSRRITILEGLIVIAIGFVLYSLSMPAVTPHGGRHARPAVKDPPPSRIIPPNP